MIELQSEIEAAVKRRRTFAIISHPDAGKTTLTEKLLLYGGAIQEAGAVKTRRAQRHTTSDWMAMEQQRGISITSTVLQFQYQGYHINLLDTPGHQDFSEDTYRTLAASDNAVMLIDAAKGLEPQTRKLFEVCRMRSLPTFTFVNKLDRPGRSPLELLDEIERELKLAVYPINYPVGMGETFQGVYDRHTKLVHLFERNSQGGRKQAHESVVALDDPYIESVIEPALLRQLKEDLEILDGAGHALDVKEVMRGRMTPIFFGSAMTNFGVEQFLQSFLEYAACPGTHESSIGEIEPTYTEFSGFVFKLQANMDPRHRDCLAFVRVCSGKFTKDMMVNHVRSNKKVRLSRPQKVFARERESLDEAFPGDVIGLNNPGVFAIGDTICTGAKIVFPGIPSFSPELFARLRSPNPSLAKKFGKGIAQLEEEGAVQILRLLNGGMQEPILAAIGQLQFDVAQFRLTSEYGVETQLEPLTYSSARWVTAGWEALNNGARMYETDVANDRWGRPVLLFRSEWHLQRVEKDRPDLQLSSVAPISEGLCLKN